MNLFLFDVDGTLTIPQKEIEKKMILTLQSIKEKKNFSGKTIPSWFYWRFRF